MKRRSLQILMCLIVAVFFCSFTTVFSAGLDISGSSGFDECTNRTRKAGLNDFVAKTGLVLIKKYESTDRGFVYSDIKIFNQLLQFSVLGSHDARTTIKNHLQLTDDKICDDKFCDSFKSIIDEINSTLKDSFFYESVLYYEKNRELFDSFKTFGDCGTSKALDFRRGRDKVLLQINSDYRRMTKMTQGDCVKTGLNPRTFYLLTNRLRLDSKIFGKMMSYDSTQRFTDLEDQQHAVEWLGVEGEFWVGAIDMTVYASDASKTCVLHMFRTEINGGNQYMVYFMLTFTGFTVTEKVRYYQKVFFNFREYVQQAINKQIDNYGVRSEGFKTLLFPVIDMNTEVDLKETLKSDLISLFNTDQITNLFANAVTLQDMRTCEQFTNKGEHHEKGTLPGQDQFHILDKPFIFTVVDRKTGLSLKTGAYLRP